MARSKTNFPLAEEVERRSSLHFSSGWFDLMKRNKGRYHVHERKETKPCEHLIDTG